MEARPAGDTASVRPGAGRAELPSFSASGRAHDQEVQMPKDVAHPRPAEHSLRRVPAPPAPVPRDERISTQAVEACHDALKPSEALTPRDRDMLTIQALARMAEDRLFGHMRGSRTLI